jgi:hypothetical protein
VEKSVYMVVGINIAKGAKVSTGMARSSEATVKLMVDRTGAGIPVKVGPKAEAKGERKEKSFVFAYRLRKITGKRDKIVQDTEFNKGVFLDLEVSQTGIRADAELRYLIDEEDVGIEGEIGGQVGPTIVDGKEDEVFIVPTK